MCNQPSLNSNTNIPTRLWFCIYEGGCFIWSDSTNIHGGGGVNQDPKHGPGYTCMNYWEQTCMYSSSVSTPQVYPRFKRSCCRKKNSSTAMHKQFKLVYWILFTCCWHHVSTYVGLSSRGIESNQPVYSGHCARQPPPYYVQPLNSSSKWQNSVHYTRVYTSLRRPPLYYSHQYLAHGRPF